MSPKRLAPDLAWPVTSSDLRSALQGIDDTNVNWVSWRKRPSDVPLWVTWAPTEAATIGGGVGSGASVWIAPVSRTALAEIRLVLTDRGLPAASDWLRAARDAPETWKASHHRREWRYDGGDLAVRDVDGVAALHQ